MGADTFIWVLFSWKVDTVERKSFYPGFYKWEIATWWVKRIIGFELGFHVTRQSDRWTYSGELFPTLSWSAMLEKTIS